MPNINNALRVPATGVLAVLALGLGLTACGGSSSGSSSTSSSANAASTGPKSSTSSKGTASAGNPATGTSSTGSSTTPAPGARGSARFAALRECLQKDGITLPAPGSRGPGGAFLGGRQLPKGVTRAQLQDAVRKCGGNGFARRSPNGPDGRVDSPVFRQALIRYAACLRQNGVNVPAPNTSGNGPIFSTKGIDTSGPKFKAAAAKCRGTLVGAFRRPAGTH